MLQSPAIHELHGDERLTVLLADVVDRANVRVIERGRSLRFPLEAGQSLGVSGNFIRQELESNEAVQPRVLSLVDDTHTSAAQLLDDAVVRDGLAEHQGQILLGSNIQVNESRGVVSLPAVKANALR